MCSNFACFGTGGEENNKADSCELIGLQSPLLFSWVVVLETCVSPFLLLSDSSAAYTIQIMIIHEQLHKMDLPLTLRNTPGWVSGNSI